MGSIVQRCNCYTYLCQREIAPIGSPLFSVRGRIQGRAEGPMRNSDILRRSGENDRFKFFPQTSGCLNFPCAANHRKSMQSTIRSGRGSGKSNMPSTHLGPTFWGLAPPASFHKPTGLTKAFTRRKWRRSRASFSPRQPCNCYTLADWTEKI